LITTDVTSPEEVPLPTEVTLTNVGERNGEEEKKMFKLRNMVGYERDLKPWDVTAETRALAELCLVLFNSSEFVYIY